MIGAYTTPEGSYPPYINISEDENGDVRISVRSAPKVREGSVHLDQGASAQITVPRAEALSLFSAGVVQLAPPPCPICSNARITTLPDVPGRPVRETVCCPMCNFKGDL